LAESNLVKNFEHSFLKRNKFVRFSDFLIALKNQKWNVPKKRWQPAVRTILFFNGTGQHHAEKTVHSGIKNALTTSRKLSN